MKYFAYNPEIELQLNKITKTITLSMNGISSDRMKEANITYKENFGVSIPRIKEISHFYPQNKQLAEQLWSKGIREMMILACLLYPIESFTEETAQEWLNDLCNEEIAQQFSSNLLSKIDLPIPTLASWINSNNQYAVAAVLLSLGKNGSTLNKQTLTETIDQIIRITKNPDIKIYHSTSVFLRLISRKNKETAEVVLEKIKDFENAVLFPQKYIYNEVYQEYTYIYKEA